MATHKRIDGDYHITTINSVDNVFITTHTVSVAGNLDVTGNLTYINVEELNIRDPFILLNSSNTGSYASNSGILTHKTSSDYAGLRYNNVTSAWQVSSSTDATGETGSWTDLVVGNAGSPGGSNTYIQYNDAGTFGGDAAFLFDVATDKVQLQGHFVLGNIGTAPSTVSNAVALYHNAQGSGGTGVYAKSATVEDELVSKSAAIVFAIIF
jgi:hypothetical protein